MEEIFRYLIDNWEWNLFVLALMVLANLQGRSAELKRFNKWAKEHSERLAELWADEMVLKEMEKDES